MILTFIYADNYSEHNTSNFMCIRPNDAINKQGIHESFLLPINDFEQNSPNADLLCNKSDIIVIERNFKGDVLTMINHWKVRGKVIIGCFDDAYQIIPETNASYKYWHNGDITLIKNGKEEPGTMFPHPMDQFVWGLKSVHAIYTPSKQLCKDWESIVPAYYNPNRFENEKYINIEKPKHEGIIIGWGGSLSHYQSFNDSGILDVLRTIFLKYKYLKLMIIGDKRVYDLIKIPEEQKVFQNYVPYDQWPSIIANFDIGLAPLAGEYDRRRSWIKPLEYMLEKIPWIASDNTSYDDIKQYGTVIKNYPEKWKEALLDNILNLDAKREIAKGKPFEFAVSTDVNANVDKILVLFKEIAKKHAKIDLK